jgi:hypothetical protein
MRGTKTRIASLAVATALVVSSTASGAATTSPAASTANAQSSWLALSMLTSSGAIGLAGTAAQPAPGMDNPPPLSPAPPPRSNGVAGVPIPVIAIWLAELAVAIYILTKHHRGHFVFPNSPG